MDLLTKISQKNVVVDLQIRFNNAYFACKREVFVKNIIKLRFAYFLL